MRLQFSKFQGAGNDFVLVDNQYGSWKLSNEQIQKICDRHIGVGSDGLILLENDPNHDYFVNFFNPDASKSFCGNGSRCAFRFAQSLGIVGESGTFGAIDGGHRVEVCGEHISISMADVVEIQSYGDDLFLSTGSPHFIRFVDNLEAVDILPEARAIRYNEYFKEGGVNVNFVVRTKYGISMRTYERGVEDETLSCGTGVTAAAIAVFEKWKGSSAVRVSTKGGDFKVAFQKSEERYSDIRLEGPVDFVFKGELEL